LFVDLPGTYSLMSNSQEEEIARDYICFGNPDVTVVVVDATCLERNLNLVYQIMELTPNVVVCVNLLDEAKKKGINIDLSKLSFLLGIPVVGTIARKQKTLNQLLLTIDKVASGELKTFPKLIKYSDEIENCIELLSPPIKEILLDNHKYLNRWICIKLFENDSKIINSISENLHINLFNENIKNKLAICRELLRTTSDFKNTLLCSIISKCEYITLQVKNLKSNTSHTKDRKIDKILTSKTFGIPIMLLFLGIIFWITIVGANYPSQFLFSIFKNIETYLIVRFRFHTFAYLAK